MCINFDKNERMFGSDATALVARKPLSTFCRLYRMIGKQANDPVFTQLKDQHFPYEAYANESTSITHLKVEKTNYTPEELLAMMMEYAKDITKTHIGKDIKDCVITVPASFTQHERKALYVAADIANLKILSLIEENTAAALQYSMDRVFDEPHNVLFYNMGSNSVQVTVVRYSSLHIKEAGKNKTIGQFEIIGKSWNNNLGGITFDMVITDMIANRFNEIWNAKRNKNNNPNYVTQNVKQFVKPMTRIKNEATKIREVLSANNEIPLKIDQLHDDVDIQMKISRADFEANCESLYAQLLAPISDALLMANVTIQDIHAVELLGGGVRMPKVKSTLDHYFKQADLELSQHLNGDEAMAFGAAFRGANISTAFRVRHIGMSDIQVFSISARLETLPTDGSSSSDKSSPSMLGKILNMFGSSDSEASDVTATESNDGKQKEDTAATANSQEAKQGEEVASEEYVWFKSTPLFPSLTPIPSKHKTLAFHYNKDILCKLFYDNSNSHVEEGGVDSSKQVHVPLPDGVDHLIMQYNITGISKFVNELSVLGYGDNVEPKVHLSFVIDGSGIVELVKAEATYDIPEVNKTTGGNVTDDSNSTSTANETSSGEGKEGKVNDTSTSAGGTSSGGKKSSKKSKVGQEPGHVLKRTLTFAENVELLKPPQWSTSLLQESRSKLKALNDDDKIRKERAEVLNKLETYLYQIKNDVSDNSEKYLTVTTQEELDGIVSLCNEIEEWLYENGMTSGVELSVYKDKEKSIKVRIDVVYHRVNEIKSRPKAIEKAKATIANITKVVTNLSNLTNYEHITEEDTEKVLTLIAKVSSWLEEKIEEQSLLTTYDDPVLITSDIQAQLKPLNLQFDKLLKKPKPPPPKVSWHMW